MSQYPGVTCVQHQEESSYLTVMDLYYKKYKKQFAIEIEAGTPLSLSKLQSKWLWVKSGGKRSLEREDGAYTPIIIILYRVWNSLCHVFLFHVVLAKMFLVLF